MQEQYISFHYAFSISISDKHNLRKEEGKGRELREGRVRRGSEEGRIIGSSACVLSRFSRVQLFGNPMACSPPGYSVHGILQAIKKKREKKYTAKRGRLTSADFVLK